MKNVLYIALGGAIGSVLRYFLAKITTSYFAEKFPELSFPVGTLTVNFIGSLIIGVAAGIFIDKDPESNIVLFVMVGLLGGFTTFSSFSLEIINLLVSGEVINGMLYIFLSVSLGIIGCLIGLYLSGAFPLK